MGGLRPLPLVIRACKSGKYQSEDSISLIQILAPLNNKDALHDGIFVSTARNSIAYRATHGVRIMNGSAARFLRLGVSLSGLLVLGWVLTGQAARPDSQGLPTDWTHRHVIFSEPATYEQIA